MLWNKGRSDAANARAAEYEREHFERELKGIFQFGRMTLAVARMTREEEFTFKGEMSGGPASQTLRHVRNVVQVFGVVHETHGRPEWSKLKKWIHATINVGGEARSPNLGTATFQARSPNDSANAQSRPFNRQLSVVVVVGDRQEELKTALANALRDKAISGDPFMHVEIGIAKFDADAALREISEGKGYFEATVQSLSFVDDITLPKAPPWGWNWSFEREV